MNDKLAFDLNMKALLSVRYSPVQMSNSQDNALLKNISSDKERKFGASAENKPCSNAVQRLEIKHCSSAEGKLWHN